MVKYTGISCFLFIVIGCKTISVQNETQHISKRQIALGSIGTNLDFLLDKGYNPIAIPEYNKSIKLLVTPIDFNEHTFKLFMEVQTIKKNDFNVNYIDSLKIKPKFLKIEISDRVTLLNTLNDKVNKDIKKYLKNKDEAHLVTTVSIAFPESIISSINKAQEVFLESAGIKSYALKLYKDKLLQSSIEFSQGIIFAYQASNFCWQQDDAYQLQIVDLVENGEDCPKKTYRVFKKKKKKINYYKF